jgi:hypothetical protein
MLPVDPMTSPKPMPSLIWWVKSSQLVSPPLKASAASCTPETIARRPKSSTFSGAMIAWPIGPLTRWPSVPRQPPASSAAGAWAGAWSESISSSERKRGASGIAGCCPV